VALFWCSGRHVYRTWEMSLLMLLLLFYSQVSVWKIERITPGMGILTQAGQIAQAGQTTRSDKTEQVAQNERINNIIRAIQAGNADDLATFFNSSIDLTLVDDDNVYSKVQADMVMKEFFQHYVPEKVSMRHSGSSANGSSYAILNYRTKAKENLRVVFYLKPYEGQLLINELRFELQK